MNLSLLELLRCPFCGTRLTLVDNQALTRRGDEIDTGVLGCECCAFPVVEGIPVIVADETTRGAMHTLEAGHPREALEQLLDLDGDRVGAFRALMSRDEPITYREAIQVLSPDAEGTYFVYHFSDPTFRMAEATLRALGRHRWTMERRVLDLCGGSGHLTRVLSRREPRGGTVIADLFFWKLWLAARIMSPGCVPVCCDANSPLPFTRDAFSLVLLVDAFPYIWHKRLLADEMMRVSGEASVIVMPHLHSAHGENYAAGMPLTPGAYRDLFAAHGARVFSDRALLEDVLARSGVDLSRDVHPEGLGDEPSLTLVASRRTDIFATMDVPDDTEITGVLKINPLYRVERRDGCSVLTLAFPTPEYEEEFGECKRYLPDSVTLPGDLTGALSAALFGNRYEELRRRRVLIDAPRNYL